MNIESVFKWVQGIVKLRGASDNTLIGNLGDRLKVDAIISNSSAGNYVDLNKAYSVVVNATMATSGSNNQLFLLKNPLGSGKKFQVSSIHCNNAVANVGANFQIWVQNTVTVNGTAVTPLARNVNNAQPASVANAYSLPTATLASNAIHSNYIGQNTTGLNIIESQPIILQPNSNLIVTGDPTSNGRLASLTIVWDEL